MFMVCLNSFILKHMRTAEWFPYFSYAIFCHAAHRIRLTNLSNRILKKKFAPDGPRFEKALVFFEQFSLQTYDFPKILPSRSQISNCSNQFVEKSGKLMTPNKNIPFRQRNWGRALNSERKKLNKLKWNGIGSMKHFMKNFLILKRDESVRTTKANVIYCHKDVHNVLFWVWRFYPNNFLTEKKFDPKKSLIKNVIILTKWLSAAYARQDCFHSEWKNSYNWSKRN